MLRIHANVAVKNAMKENILLKDITWPSLLLFINASQSGVGIDKCGHIPHFDCLFFWAFHTKKRLKISQKRWNIELVDKSINGFTNIWMHLSITSKFLLCGLRPFNAIIAAFEFTRRNFKSIIPGSSSSLSVTMKITFLCLTVLYWICVIASGLRMKLRLQERRKRVLGKPLNYAYN